MHQGLHSRSSLIRRAVCLTGVAVAPVLLIAACSNSTTVAEDATASTVPSTTTAVAALVEQDVGASNSIVIPAAASRTGDTPTTTLLLPSDSDATAEAGLDGSNVIAAALVIAAGGDVEQALLNGEFTVNEVDAAVAAIESGTLSQYAG